MMQKNLIYAGLASLGLAVITYLVDLTRISFFVGSINVRIYLTAFFALLGLVLIFRAVWKQVTA
jgi:hypothetical protein